MTEPTEPKPIEVDPNSAAGKAIKNGGAIIVWWKSKKFVAYMFGDFLWKVILFTSLVIIAEFGNGTISGTWLTFLFAVVVTAGVAQMGFLGGQSWIDRYTTAIKIPAKLGSMALGGVADVIGEKRAAKAPEPVVEDELPVDDEDDIPIEEGDDGP